MHVWRGRYEHDPLERALRTSRPEPDDQLVQAILHRLLQEEHPRHPYRPRLGLTLASAVTAALLVPLAAFGGFGYAQTGAAHAVKTVGHLVAPPKVSPNNAKRKGHRISRRLSNNSANAQYCPPASPFPGKPKPPSHGCGNP